MSLTPDFAPDPRLVLWQAAASCHQVLLQTQLAEPAGITPPRGSPARLVLTVHVAGSVAVTTILNIRYPINCACHIFCCESDNRPGPDCPKTISVRNLKRDLLPPANAHMIPAMAGRYYLETCIDGGKINLQQCMLPVSVPY